jgi:hypothetical protein
VNFDIGAEVGNSPAAVLRSGKHGAQQDQSRKKEASPHGQNLTTGVARSSAVSVWKNCRG